MARHGVRGVCLTWLLALTTVASTGRANDVPVIDSGALSLTVGGEYRLKVEGLHNPSFDIQHNPDYTATGERFLAQADLRTSAGPRLFVQLSAATDSGRKPLELPLYRSALDLAQGYLELPLGFHGAQLNLRLGRQELDFDGNRLVSNREVTNLRRAFDAAVLTEKWQSWSVQEFVSRPVRNRGGAFDDDATPGEKFWGARLRHAPEAFASAGELFYFIRSRLQALYQGGIGPELRRTVGLRSSGRSRGFDYATQAALQRGTVGRLEIRAYGIASDVGYTLQYGWHPRFGLSAGFASGGKAGRDGQLRTFDSLYPNLGYFTDAPLIYPGNDWDFQPNVTIEPISHVTLRGGVDFLHRVSRNDAVYEQPGFALIPGTGVGSNAIGELSYVRLDWRVKRYWDLYASYVYGGAGALVSARGGRDTRYFALQSDVKL